MAPKQKGDKNCGVYLCTNSQNFALNQNLQITPNDIESFRQQIAIQVMRNEGDQNFSALRKTLALDVSLENQVGESGDATLQETLMQENDNFEESNFDFDKELDADENIEFEEEEVDSTIIVPNHVLMTQAEIEMDILVQKLDELALIEEKMEIEEEKESLMEIDEETDQKSTEQKETKQTNKSIGVGKKYKHRRVAILEERYKKMKKLGFEW